MHKVPLTPYFLIAAAIVGLGDTLFLSYYHIIGAIPSCALKGCDIVLSSAYSSPFGMPFAYLGLLYYAFMLFLALLLGIDPFSKGLRLGILAYTGVGLVCSIGFELFQYFVIGALCMYCGISALATLLLFAFASRHYRLTQTG